MPNRLADALSPYLAQHADNPVDWWPWGEEAFAQARDRDVPVFLSVGYAACHWCHVMAHESFEDETVAAALRDDFVAVKVDREERPDIDAVYMAATHALSGRGGWPMTVLLTPDGRPFWAGTYLPRHQLLQLLAAASSAWHERRDDVEESATQVTAAVAAAVGVDGGSAPRPVLDVDDDSDPPVPTPEALAAAVRRVATSYDVANGGFGGAPKFPPSMVLEWLLAHHGRHAAAGRGSDEAATALLMAEQTAEAMARGGMYDQLAGGFARYSVDARWVVPHFEKMLYDNALLLGVYARLHRAGAAPLAARIARETADFLVRDLGTAQGAFASALDADTAGVEGLTYAWTPAQLADVLGPDDGARAAELLSVTAAGTFEHGASTLQLRADPADPAWWEEVRTRLLGARATRPQPARDDKVVTAWNGLAIASLAEAGVLLDEPSYVDAARACASYLLDTHLVGDRLRRASRDGIVGAAGGVSVDYGNLAGGLLALAQATGEARWVEAAGHLLEVAMRHFGTPDGGFADTPDDGEALVARPREIGDNAEPCGQSALAGALLTYGALTGSAAHVRRARAAVAATAGLALQSPRFGGRILAVSEALAAGPLEVAVAVPADDPGAAAALVGVARASLSPGLVLAVGTPDAAGWPLLAGRSLRDGAPTVYVCRGFVCEAPVTTPDGLRAALAG